MNDTSLRERLKRDFRGTAVVGAFLLVFLLLVLAFRGVIVPFLVAMFIAYLVEPLIARLAGVKIGPLKFGRAGSVIVLYLLLGAVLTLTVIGLLPRVSQQVSSLARSAPEAFQTVRNDWIPRIDVWIDEMMGPDEQDATDGEDAGAGDPALLPPTEPSDTEAAREEEASAPAPIDEWTLEFPWEGKLIRGRVYHGPVRDDGPAPKPTTLASAMDALVEDIQTHFVGAVGVVTAVLGGVVGFVYTFVLILMITAFMVIDRQRISAYFDSLAPDRYREQYRRGIRIVDAGLSGVVRGQILVCIINGALTLIGLVILGVPYALLLAAIATVFSLIPIFGTILSSIPIVAIALSQGLGYGLSALAWITVIHLLEANVINPRVIGSTARLHPIIIVFALLAGEHAFGVVGALLAVPAASILVSAFRYARTEAAAESPADAEPLT